MQKTISQEEHEKQMQDMKEQACMQYEKGYFDAREKYKSYKEKYEKLLNALAGIVALAE